jgi:NAD+ synthase (glutamine-hydrolysing)
MKIALAQLNYRIGDFERNTSKMYEAITEARSNGADLVIFSELAVCGYPPDDLLDYDWFVEKCEQSMEAVAECCQGIAAVAGGVLRNRDTGRGLFNVACFMQNGRIQKVVKKTLLPTYDVFAESRYFEPSDTVEVIEFKGYKLGIAICEDIWDLYNDFRYEKSPVQALKEAGAQLIIHPSASPFHVGKIGQRDKVFAGNAERFGLPIIYVNQVGAHADLIFDGDSQVINSKGETVKQLPLFAEAIEYVTLGNTDFLSLPVHFAEPDEPASIHEALVYGIRDYFHKMGFKKAILGASGGIDSAVVQCLASSALGPENVTAFLMPSQYSSEGSVNDAKKLSENLGNRYKMLPITEMFDAGTETLKNLFAETQFGIAEENMQARIRGLLLMSYSNKFGDILLNTSNKSEMSVGYSTLYGDMCGSLSPIGDVYKSKVYSLARFINRQEEVIPGNILTKAPSAELRPGQKDSDSLPDYPVLDEILRFYIDERKGRDEIITHGYDPNTVDKILKLVNNSEYKRFQAPPILRVSGKAFGRGRNMPLVAWYG